MHFLAKPSLYYVSSSTVSTSLKRLGTRSRSRLAVPINNYGRDVFVRTFGRRLVDGWPTFGLPYPSIICIGEGTDGDLSRSLLLQ